MQDNARLSQKVEERREVEHMLARQRGHLDVEQNEIGLLTLDELRHPQRRFGRDDLVSRSFEKTLGVAQCFRVVIDHHDLALGHQFSDSSLRRSSRTASITSVRSTFGFLNERLSENGSDLSFNWKT